MSSIGQDDWRRNDTSKHGECVLKSKEKGEEDRHTIVKTEEGCRTASLLHEWQIGLEQEGVVIFSDEPISEKLLVSRNVQRWIDGILGRKSLDKPPTLLSKTSLRCVICSDAVRHCCVLTVRDLSTLFFYEAWSSSSWVQMCMKSTDSFARVGSSGSGLG